MTTYAYEVLLRGTPDHGLKIKGCHLIEATVVNGRDYPGDPVPINFADLDGLLPGWFSGMAGQVAAAEAATDIALADLAARTVERDAKAAEIEALTTAKAAEIAALTADKAALEARIAELTAPPAVDAVHIAYVKQALDEMGMLSAVDAAADAAGKGALWRYATSITGTEPDVMAVAEALGIDLSAVMSKARALRAARA